MVVASDPEGGLAIDVTGVGQVLGQLDDHDPAGMDRDRPDDVAGSLAHHAEKQPDHHQGDEAVGNRCEISDSAQARGDRIQRRGAVELGTRQGFGFHEVQCCIQQRGNGRGRPEGQAAAHAGVQQAAEKGLLDQTDRQPRDQPAEQGAGEIGRVPLVRRGREMANVQQPLRGGQGDHDADADQEALAHGGPGGPSRKG